MSPIPRPETRLAYSSSTPRRISVRDFGAAAFLHVKNHAVLHVGRDARQKLVYYFDGDALGDLDLYYQARNHLRALTDRVLAADAASEDDGAR